MRTMKNFILTLSALLFAFTLTAQSGKLKKADNYHSKIAYHEAAELYKDLIGSEVDSPQLKAKLADCYFQMGETELAEKYYSEMINSDQVENKDVYQYAQALKENKKYSESDKWMKKYNQMNPSDSRSKEFIENTNYIHRIHSQDPYFKIGKLKINTPETEFGGYKNGDKIYFVSNRVKKIAVQRYHSWNNKTFLDVYEAEIGDDNEIENASYHSKKTNKIYHEGPLCFSKDGKTVFFTRNNISKRKDRSDDKGIQNLKMYSASIDDEGNWVDEKELTISSTHYSVGHPTLSPDEKFLIFSSDMPGGYGGADIYKVELKPDGSLGQVTNLGAEINSEGQEMFPWMSEDSTLFLSSDGHLGLGGLDVFAVVFNKDGAFKKMINLGKPVNGPKDDFALILNPDNKTGYVSSNRSEGRGDDDIYSVTLLRPIKVNLMLKGLVADSRTNELLPNSLVELVDEEGNVVATTQSGADASYSLDLEEDKNYTVRAKQTDYFDDIRTVTTKDLDPNIEVIEQDLLLEKDPGLSLYALITDTKTGLPLEGVKVTLLDNMTGVSEEYTTEASGDLRKALMDKKLNDRGSYNLTLEKDGYFSKTVTYNTEFDREGQYDVHAKLNLAMDPEVTDLSEMIEINPINFDLNKYNIRPDAAIELDKIVEVMNQYPGLVIELGAHTDCRGSIAYNRKLSDRRAKASAKYIKDRITNPERIYGKGYGESKLLNGCECEGRVKSDCSEEEHSKNRRTEFKVISTGNDKLKVNNNSTDSFE